MHEDRPVFNLKHWEMNALLIQNIVFAAGLSVLVWYTLPKWLLKFVAIPTSVWAGIAFFLVGLCLYPTLSIRSRNIHRREIPFGRHVILALLGSILGAIFFAFLH